MRYNEHHMHAHTLLGCYVTITTNVANSGDERDSRRVSCPWLDVGKGFLYLRALDSSPSHEFSFLYILC
jgi:hypothetical protein